MPSTTVSWFLSSFLNLPYSSWSATWLFTNTQAILIGWKTGGNSGVIIRRHCKLANISWSSLSKCRMHVEIALLEVLDRWRVFTSFFSLPVSERSNSDWFHLVQRVLAVWFAVNKSSSMNCTFHIWRIDKIFRVNVTRWGLVQDQNHGYFVVNAGNNRLSIPTWKLMLATFLW